MKKMIIIGLAIVHVLFMFADEKSTYIQLLNENKMEQLKAHLESWKIEKPKDPEMFIGFFNYYINMAKKENIVFGGKNPPKKGDYFIISDSKTGEKTGYMYGEINYDPKYAELALTTINEGLQIAPDRLDMHFGKTRLFAELKSFEMQKKQLLLVFDRINVNKYIWYWSDNKLIDDNNQLFINSIHDYIAEWFDLQNDIGFNNAKEISEKLIQYFPNSTIGYNDNALVYAQTGDIDKAEIMFLKGYSVNNNDLVVIGNLAYLYESKNNKSESIKYYKKMLDSGNDRAKEYARKKINKLEQ
jgi:tetratricopeptide (TPR) repeat protein